jgi:hypothetical protein
VEETVVSWENHRTAVSHWQTLSCMLYRVHSAWMGFELVTLVVKCTDCIGSCKSNDHTITVNYIRSSCVFRNVYEHNASIFFAMLITQRGNMKFYDKRDYFSFLLWTFHFHVASLQQHLHLEYISRSWSDIPYHDFLDRGLLLTRKQLNQVEVITSKVYRSYHDLLTVVNRISL